MQNHISNYKNKSCSYLINPLTPRANIVALVLKHEKLFYEKNAF